MKRFVIRGIAIVLAILALCMTNGMNEPKAIAATSASTLSRDICIYSQWDCDVYPHTNGDGLDWHFVVSGCGWHALAHAIQWLGLEGKDVEEPGSTPLPLLYYNLTGYKSSKTGIGVSSDPMKFLKQRYSRLVVQSKSVSTLRDALRAGKVSTIHLTWNGGGHYFTAVELSADGNYVHVIDSVLNVSYNHIPNVYIRNENGTFTKLGKSEVEYRKIAAKSIAWHCTSVKNGTMSKNTSAHSDYAGGDYWLEYDYVSQYAEAYLSATPSTESSYLSNCTYYPSYGTIRVSKTSTVKSLPCSNSTNSASADVESATGKTFVQTGVFKNTAGNYWYRVTTSGEKTGFVYSGDVDQCTTRNDDLTISSDRTIPTNLTQGSSFPTKGTVSTEYSQLVSVYACIKQGNTVLYEKTVNASGNTLSIYQSDINAAMKFRDIPAGSYTYIVAGTVRDYYTGTLTNNGNLYNTSERVNVIEAPFTVTASGTPITTSEEYFNNNKEATNCYMVIMNGPATLYTTPNESGAIASLTVNSNTMSVAPRYHVVYTDFYGINENGVAFYHLANGVGFICDQLAGTYVKADLLEEPQNGKYVVCNFSKDTTKILVHSGPELSSSTVTSWNRGTSFYFTGELECAYNSNANLPGGLGSVRKDNIEGWANFGYFVYDSTHAHTYSDATYADSYGHFVTCTDCGYTNYVAHTIVTDAAVSPTCTSTGLTGGTHCAECGGTIISQEVVPALGHNYGAPVWTWNGYASASAKFTCANNSSHTQTVNATITSAVTTAATCTANGVRTYTATVTFNGQTYTNTKTETIAALGHNYGAPTWTWDGYSSATAMFTCSRDGSHTQTVSASIVSEVTTAATSLADGVRTYTASVVFNGMAYSDVRTETIPRVNDDTIAPTGIVTSTINVAVKQTVTLYLSDDKGIAGYYWGTSKDYESNTFTATDESVVSFAVSKSGNYYLVVKDTSGNLSEPQKIVFCKTTLDANGGKLSPKYVLSMQGTKILLPVPAKSGQYFDGWYTEAEGGKKVDQYAKITKNSRIYAHWSDTDTLVPTGVVTATRNIAVKQTVTLKLQDNAGVAGYYWGTSKNYADNTFTATSASSVSFSVTRSGNYYLTVVDANGLVSETVQAVMCKTNLNANGGNLTPRYALTMKGALITLPTPTRAGYQFDGWYTAAEGGTRLDATTKITKNGTIYAHWTEIAD